MSAEELDLYEDLLNEQDPELFKWISGKCLYSCFNCDYYSFVVILLLLILFFSCLCSPCILEYFGLTLSFSTHP